LSQAGPDLHGDHLWRGKIGPRSLLEGSNILFQVRGELLESRGLCSKDLAIDGAISGKSVFVLRADEIGGQRVDGSKSRRLTRFLEDGGNENSGQRRSLLR